MQNKTSVNSKKRLNAYNFAILSKLNTWIIKYMYKYIVDKIFRKITRVYSNYIVKFIRNLKNSKLKI